MEFILNNPPLLLGLVILVLIGWPVLFFGAPVLPSFRRRDDIDFSALFKILQEERVERVVDLGSGDGRLIRKLAEAGFETTGVEIHPLWVWWSRWKLKKSDIENAHIRWGNLWSEDLSRYDAVFIFHIEAVNRRLVKKCKKQMGEGGLVVSTGFKLEGLKLIDTAPPFYIYQLPT